MSSDALWQSVQKSLRVTLGATATLVEGIQDPQKLQQDLAGLTSNFDQTLDKWAQKGEATEQQARGLVEQLLVQPSGSSNAADASPAAAAPLDIQLELQELTAQIAAIRKELES